MSAGQSLSLRAKALFGNSKNMAILFEVMTVLLLAVSTPPLYRLDRSFKSIFLSSLTFKIYEIYIDFLTTEYNIYTYS